MGGPGTRTVQVPVAPLKQIHRERRDLGARGGGERLMGLISVQDQIALGTMAMLQCDVGMPATEPRPERLSDSGFCYVFLPVF